MVAHGQAEGDGRGHEVAVPTIAPLRRVVVTHRAAPRPTSRRNRMATRARCRAWASACVPIDQTTSVNARPSPASTPRATERVSALTRSTVTAGGHGEAQGREQVHPQGRLAERLSRTIEASQPSRT